MQVHLTTDQDVFVWNLTASGNLSVKSMYLGYEQRFLKMPITVKLVLGYMNGHTKYLKKIYLEVESTSKN
jgi:hypothetical protein